MDNTTNNNNNISPLVNKLEYDIKNIKDQNLLVNAIDNFVQDCLKRNEKISDIQSIIFDLISTRPKDIFQIIKGFTQGMLQSKSLPDIQDVILKLVNKNKKNTHQIIRGFFHGCNYPTLSEKDKTNIKNRIFEEVNLEPIDLELIKNDPFDVIDSIYIFIQYCLAKNKNILNIKDVILSSINLESVKKELSNTYLIIREFVKGCLEQNKEILDIQNVMLDLINKSLENISAIISGFIIGSLEQNKSIQDLRSFLVQIIGNKNTNINIIYKLINKCTFDARCQSNSENMNQLMEIIVNNDNKNIKESKQVLFGMHVSNYLFKLFQKQNDENIELPEISSKFIDLLNEFLNRDENNKITKIKDLTIKEIKQLFNNLMNIKFNQTKDSINNNNVKIGPFLQIIVSLAENSEVNENTTVNELFDRNSSKNQIKKYQNKINKFNHIDIKQNTQISSIVDFLKVFKLEKEDFGKEGFKTFYAEFPEHAVTVVVDTSKSYDEFINNNENIINDIVMIDSSYGIKCMMNTGKLKFSNQQTQDFIRKIPVPNKIYQKNGTCWANTCCTNTVLLNNCKNFDDIVDRKKNSVTLKDEIQDEIIFETSEYFLSNVNRIEKESEYQKIDDIIFKTVKIDYKQNQLFQQPYQILEARKRRIDKIEKQLDDLELKITLEKKSSKEFARKKEEYDKHLKILEKDIKRLNNIKIVEEHRMPLISKFLKCKSGVTCDHLLRRLEELSEKVNENSSRVL